MRSRGTPTRLEVHRLKYNQLGRQGPLLTYGDLDRKEKQFLQDQLLKDVRVANIGVTGDNDEVIYDQVLLGLLAEFGIMCPHSVQEPAEHKQAARCCVCGALVVSWWRKAPGQENKRVGE